jgi:actin-related protein 8
LSLPRYTFLEPDHLPPHCSFSLRMVGKRSGKALLREEGLERTDNNMDLTSWPQVVPINQKNYYVEYLKRDEQILAYRQQQDEARSRMVKIAQDRDRARNLNAGAALGPDGDVDMEDEQEAAEDEVSTGTKTIVIHLGSQNMRIGFASDALPKTVPMVVARQATQSECEEGDGEPKPKRVKLDNGAEPLPEQRFGDAFAKEFTGMSTELKQRMRMNKRRVLPQSRDMVVSYNRRTGTDHDTITEHNDTMRVEWTDVTGEGKGAPEYIAGKAALRIPDYSKPRYKLYWPIRHGWVNEVDYKSKWAIYDDIRIIIQEALTTQLGMNVRSRKDLAQHSCVIIVPDYYERTYVSSLLDMALTDFGFNRVCFIQESLAASFGAGFTTTCVVDMGAQKTSICCVEDGMCIESSRINLKYGGQDVTDKFMKMMLYDHFPYADINLRRRYDFTLAEELKQKLCTMTEADISVQMTDFFLRAPNQDTRKYTFKYYDEVFLAPMGFFKPEAFDDPGKIAGRRRLVDLSYDIYEGTPNDPKSSAQAEILALIAPEEVPKVTINGEAATNGDSNGHPAENGSNPLSRRPSITRVKSEATPQGSIASSPVRDLNDGTPMPEGTPAPDDEAPAPQASVPKPLDIEHRADILPLYPLPSAIITSITHASRGSPAKTRDFLASIMLIGGASMHPGLNTYLEEQLQGLLPGYAKEIVVGRAPRELDAQVVVWKGGAVFGRMVRTNDSWVDGGLYERLGERVLSYKCMWGW